MVIVVSPHARAMIAPQIWDHLKYFICHSQLYVILINVLQNTRLMWLVLADDYKTFISVFSLNKSSYRWDFHKINQSL